MHTIAWLKLTRSILVPFLVSTGLFLGIGTPTYEQEPNQRKECEQIGPEVALRCVDSKSYWGHNIVEILYKNEKILELIAHPGRSHGFETYYSIALPKNVVVSRTVPSLMYLGGKLELNPIVESNIDRIRIPIEYRFMVEIKDKSSLYAIKLYVRDSDFPYFSLKYSESTNSIELAFQRRMDDGNGCNDGTSAYQWGKVTAADDVYAVIITNASEPCQNVFFMKIPLPSPST